MNRIQLSINEITTTPLAIGFEGENEYTEVTFYWTTLFSQYPDAVATMVIRPSGGDAYPKAITQDDNRVVWEVSASDTAKPGKGEYQLTFTNGTEVIKSYIGTFNVMESITGSGEAPDPIQDWIDDANEKLAEVDSAISQIESVMVEDVTVTGATPSITAENNKRYLCGTLTSLTITKPESGYFEVVFTSGATATTLTATGITFPSWFTPEANYKYEISVMDGMGVVAAWPTT